MNLFAFARPSDPPRVLTAGLMLGGIVLASFLLSQVDWAYTFSVFASTSALALATAFLATGFSFCGLAAYDVIAVRHLGLRGVTNLRAATAGAVGFGVSNFVGLPWLTGAMVRHVYYRDTGVGLGPFTTVVLASWVAFWTSVAAIIALVLIVHPDIAARLGLPVDGAELGMSLLIGCGVLMIWLSSGRRIRFRGRTVEFLGRRVTVLQCSAALADLAGSAAVLYVFLPAGVAGDAASFFGLFVLAVGLGVLSHVPAGLGAFEGTMVLGLHGVDRTAITAALVLYRMCRTVLPFLIASAMLTAFVLARRSRARNLT